jgi:hypothetical protein
VNLHAVANAAISRLHPNEEVTLLRALPQDNAEGVLAPRYADAETVTAQVQSEKEAMQQFTGETLTTVHTRKMWLFGSPGDRPGPLYRPLAKAGDMIGRADGTWWQVTADLEDFSRSGWVSVRATLQAAPPTWAD